MLLYLISFTVAYFVVGLAVSAVYFKESHVRIFLLPYSLHYIDLFDYFSHWIGVVLLYLLWPLALWLLLNKEM